MFFGFALQESGINVVLQILEKNGLAVFLILFVLLVLWKKIMPFIEGRFDKADKQQQDFIAAMEKRDAVFIAAMEKRDAVFSAMSDKRDLLFTDALNKSSCQLKENTEALVKLSDSIEDLSDRLHSRKPS